MKAASPGSRTESGSARDAGAPESPYAELPARQFWKLGVGQHDLQSVPGIYSKRFSIGGMKIATAGSCFALHIARSLRKAGFEVLDKEPPPRGLKGKAAQRFGYLLYSARHGNIYTARRLLQLAREALGLLSPAPPVLVWERNGRFFDSLRPNVEPDGLATAEEVLAQRRDHLRRFRQVLEEADLFIFTLGLTESWVHRDSGLVYAVAPGVIAGTYDPALHEFVNFRFQDIYSDLVEFRSLAHSVNPDMKFMLTVSPVPLTATAAGEHVLTATVRSKSVLRAAAGQLAEDFDDVDYFPSYDLISTPFLGPSRFEENRRNVSADGVAAVMAIFLEAHGGADRALPEVSPAAGTGARAARPDDDDPCEDAMLEAFAGKR